MATYNLPPPPNPDESFSDYSWRDWFRQIRDFIVNVVQDHQRLNNLQGGNTNERYHLSRDQYNSIANKQVEVQTATENQTTFILTTITYVPGSKTLSVYIDGVNQILGSSYAYVETNSTTVTFTQGLHLGAIVKFVVS